MVSASLQVRKRALSTGSCEERRLWGEESNWESQSEMPELDFLLREASCCLKLG